MMPAGMLDRKINIEQLVVTRDGMGSAIEQYSTQYANVPANMKPFTGREKYKVESAREMTYKQYKFTIRYIAGLTQKHRILFEGEYYDILFIADIGRRQDVEILAQLAE